MCFGFVTRTLVATLLAASLGGCSEYYFDRRDTVSLHSGEAMAANRVTQTIDPWSPASGNRNIAYNGEKAAVASERYRTGHVIPPANALTMPSTMAVSPARRLDTRSRSPRASAWMFCL